MPVYALILARADRKLGPSLVKPVTDCGEGPAGLRRCGLTQNWTSKGATFKGGSIPMTRLATALGTPLGRIILDRTGLAGTFDVDLAWTPNQSADTSGPSLFTALQEQLGLKLESTRGPVEVLVIDRVEQPTPD